MRRRLRERWQAFKDFMVCHRVTILAGAVLIALQAWAGLVILLWLARMARGLGLLADYNRTLHRMNTFHLSVQLGAIEKKLGMDVEDRMAIFRETYFNMHPVQQKIFERDNLLSQSDPSAWKEPTLKKLNRLRRKTFKECGRRMEY